MFPKVLGSCFCLRSLLFQISLPAVGPATLVVLTAVKVPGILLRIKSLLLLLSLLLLKSCQLFVFPTIMASLLLPVYHAAGVPAVASVPTVDNIPLTRVSTSSGALLLFMFLAVPNISCASVVPAALVVLTTVNVPGFLMRLKSLLLLLS